MNRAEFISLLDDVCREIAEPGGNYEGMAASGRLSTDEVRAIAAVALAAADRYYSNLTKLLSERKEL